MNSTDSAIIKLITEYIPKKKQVAIDAFHTLNTKYSCSNPEGPVSNYDCPDDDPLCNCPCPELQPKTSRVVPFSFVFGNQGFFDANDGEDITGAGPEITFAIIKDVFDGRDGGTTLYDLISMHETETEANDVLAAGGVNAGIEYDEPTDTYLNTLFSETKECEQIESVLGEKWLGCDWENPTSSFSCNCPCVGEYYTKYLRFNKTVSTFWDTPPIVPLIAQAQRAALLSQQISITIRGDMSIRPGDLVNLDIISPPSDLKKIVGISRKYPQLPQFENNIKYNGHWLVSTIRHKFYGTSSHRMELVLVRDGMPSSAADEELVENLET